MCPITEKYISEIYFDRNGIPVQIDGRTVRDIVSNAREVLARTERGAKLVFPDIKIIRDALLDQLSSKEIFEAMNDDQTLSFPL
jgi:hypothetical protein